MGLIPGYHAAVEPVPPPRDAEPDPTETFEYPAITRGPLGGAGGDAYSLIVAAGPRRGMHWSVGEGVEAGRNPEAGIFLDDVTVSRHHAQFSIEDGRLVVRDLGSTNGTYVNGERCDEAVLGPGDQVFIGRFRLVVASEA